MHFREIVNDGLEPVAQSPATGCPSSRARDPHSPAPAVDRERAGTFAWNGPSPLALRLIEERLRDDAAVPGGVGLQAEDVGEGDAGVVDADGTLDGMAGANAGAVDQPRDQHVFVH